MSWIAAGLGLIPFVLVVYAVRRVNPGPLAEVATYGVFWALWLVGVGALS